MKQKNPEAKIMLKKGTRSSRSRSASKSRSKSALQSTSATDKDGGRNSKTLNFFEEAASSPRTSVGLSALRNFLGECGTDMRCHCVKSILRTESATTSLVSTEEPESSGSAESLDRRLTTPLLPLSIAERRLPKMAPVKLFKKRVDRNWHKRYNYVLPEDQQFDLQPYDEIQARDEEIAVEYFYGTTRPSWLMNNSKESADLRARILHRYNKEKRMEEEALTQVCPTVTHTRVESIISVNRTRGAQTSYLFGPSMAERQKTLPVITFIQKLCRQRARDKERQLHPLPPKSRWHMMRLNWVREEIKSILIAEKKVQARKKFCRTTKVVRAVVRFIRVISIMSRDARHVLTEIHYFQENQRLQTQLKIANKTDQKNGPIASRDVFDPNKYRFSSRFKISNEIRMILTKPWNLRSDEEVHKVVERLQELRCFVEYPISFQHKLARMAWLIEVAADLAIIREGHFAADFYFMLAGKAKMIKLHGSPYLGERGTFHILRFIRNGDAFGDESMSHPDSVRAYSVITTEKSILLSLSSVDYISMLQKTRDDEQAPEHILFLSTLAFLKDFPKHKLIEEGDEYIRNYYLRAGSVITEALSYSEYIYVVKYGSCRVLVEMMPHGAELSRKRRSTQELACSKQFENSIPDDKINDHTLPCISRVSSVLEFLYSHREEIGRNATAIQALKHMKKAHIDKEYEQTKAEADKFKRKSRKMFSSLRPTTIAQSADSSLRAKFSFGSTVTKRQSVEEEEINSEESVLSQANSTQSSGQGLDFDNASSMSIDVKNSSSSRQNVEKHLSFVVNPMQFPKQPKVTKSHSSGARHAVGTTINMDIDFDRPAQSGSSMSHFIKVAKSLSSNAASSTGLGQASHTKLPALNRTISATRRDRDLVRKPSLMRYSRWKLIKTMVKGDYIGHEWVDLNLGPFEPPEEEMSLVSDGCEVIMMNRAFLIKYLRKEL